VSKFDTTYVCLEFSGSVQVSVFVCMRCVRIKDPSTWYDPNIHKRVPCMKLKSYLEAQRRYGRRIVLDIQPTNEHTN